MDGFEAADGVIVLAATNIPETLDAALTRPGRFDRHGARAVVSRLGQPLTFLSRPGASNPLRIFLSPLWRTQWP